MRETSNRTSGSLKTKGKMNTRVSHKESKLTLQFMGGDTGQEADLLSSGDLQE